MNIKLLKTSDRFLKINNKKIYFINIFDGDCCYHYTNDFKKLVKGNNNIFCGTLIHLHHCFLKYIELFYIQEKMIFFFYHFLYNLLKIMNYT